MHANANFVVIHVVSSSFSGSTVGTYDAEYCSGDHRAHVRTRVHTGVGASRSKIAIPLALPSMFNLLALMLRPYFSRLLANFATVSRSSTCTWRGIES